VVIASKSAMKGNESIRNAGIPVVEINTGANNEVGSCQKEFELIGELLGDPETAAELVSFWDENLQAITDRLQSVPADARVRLFYALGDLTHTNGGQAWGQALITAAGGINVAEEMGSMKDTGLEQVIKWDPEAMILSSNEGRFISIAEVIDNSQLRGVKAVEDKRVFLCPVGGFWWDRPSPEAVLGITWLAKALYPEQCADLDLEDLAKEFFKRFYGYDLSTTEYEAFLAPTS
jgi:iron complex transport system substrate-binding protein